MQIMFCYRSHLSRCRRCIRFSQNTLRHGNNFVCGRSTDNSICQHCVPEIWWIARRRKTKTKRETSYTASQFAGTAPVSYTLHTSVVFVTHLSFALKKPSLFGRNYMPHEENLEA